MRAILAQRRLPEDNLLLAVLLVLLLGSTAKSTISSALKMYKKESLEILKRDGNISGNSSNSSSSSSNSGVGIMREVVKNAEEDGIELNAVVSNPITNATNTNTNNTSASEEEQEQEEEQEVDDENDQEDDEENLNASSSLLSKSQRDKNAKSDEKTYDKDLVQILNDERNIPWPKVIVLIGMFIVVLIINLLKGGGGFKSPLGITCGSKSFWLANITMLAFISCVSLWVRSYLVERFHVKSRVGYKYVEGDIKWNERNTIVYPCICCFAGFFAGMFGVGGGIVKGPLMLAMGVHPAVSSATSATMILFTSFTATTSFIVFGLLIPDYAIVCLIVGFISTYIGQVGLSMLMKKNDRNSYIAFSIGGVVALSCFLMGVQSLVSLAEGKKHHSGGLCGKGD